MCHSMNYDLDTEEGMSNAVEWTRNLIDQIVDGGTWIVPRSGTLVHIDKHNRRCTIVGLAHDGSIGRVLTAAGYTVIDGQVL